MTNPAHRTTGSDIEAQGLYENLISKEDLEFATPEQAAFYRAADLAVLETGTPSESEEPLRGGDGVTRTILTRKTNSSWKTARNSSSAALPISPSFVELKR